MANAESALLSPEKLAARILELDKVLALVAKEAVTVPAKTKLSTLQPAVAKAENAVVPAVLRAELNLVSACKDLIAEAGTVPLNGIEDLTPFLEEIHFAESWLAPHELLLIAATFAALTRIRDYRNRVTSEAETLYRPLAPVFSSIDAFAPLLKLIESCINQEEELRDSASLELQDIRRRITAARRQIHNNLHEVLSRPDLAPYIQENLITIRNQRYVVPLRTNFRGAIDGIIHDHSRSRQTFFVEPLNSVSLNNSLALLLQEEKQEEIAILKMIADRLREATDAIKTSLAQVFALDQLQAKAKFALKINACAPQLLESWEESGFILKQARHPLLAAAAQPGQVVAIDIEFPARRYGLVISGANTGGKTVSLKTAGLLALMARCGLLLPVAPESRIPLFDKVLATIGDEQNLAASLSTFSGHLLAVKAILEVATPNSLVLLDELGVGTDPKEGAALAQAILIELKKRRTRFMVTTHYNDVKAYAYEEEGISSVAVAFDPKTFTPLYHLQYGVPGLSNALVIARNLGFTEDLIEQARSLLDENEVRTTTLAARLEKRLANSANHETELLKLKQQARIEKEKAARLTGELEAARENLKNRAREEIAELVKEARLKFKTRISELETSKTRLDSALHQLNQETTAETVRQRAAADLNNVKIGRLRGSFNEARAEVAELTPQKKSETSSIDFKNIKANDRVMVTGQKKAATVISCDKEGKRFTVMLDGNLRLNLSAAQITRHLPRQNDAKNENSAGNTVKIRTVSGGNDLLENSLSRNDHPDSGSARLGVSGATLVLNLIGKRVEEALDLLIPFIDQAVVGGQERVELIHGYGTGRLRQGLHEALQNMPYVSNFFHPDNAAGGAAITIVELIKR